MQKVIGIGGVFLRARDPKALALWYQNRLGIDLAPTDMETPPWISKAGATVFAPFAEDTDYFPHAQQVMINFRVTDLGAMLAQLHASNVESCNETDMEGIGKFAHIADPEGNVVELWEPAS